MAQKTNPVMFWGALGGALALTTGATAWMVSSRHADEARAAHAVPPERTVDALKKESTNPGNMMDTVRDAMNREDLTDEQRRQIGENVREVWRQRIDARVKEYFGAKSDEEKQAVLDKHLDEMQAQMQDFE